ncbi:hypothetical protein [Thalassolituus marinus]|uniref:Uncharacterized protein n=1 Tax=Thalassolituus marinus TaxID=671053 RepID=A0ABS7ZQ21_9GAMM|nr:hypothetical protein [Thalassolituus marinus]MCA6062581.1 hypothetical protein [Thalassolituus marinus]
MEGVVEFLPFWVGYLLFAMIGYWCWRGLFFWLSPESDVRRFLNMLGVVLLFTPAPIEAGSAFFAPVFVVLPFTILAQGMTAAMYSVTWLLSGLCIGVVVLALRQLVRWFRARGENND